MLQSDFNAVADNSYQQSSPSLGEKTKNLLTSAATFAADGGKLVSEHDRQARLTACETCEFLIRGRSPECEVCGCKVLVKSHGRAFRCPLARWPNDPPLPPQILAANLQAVHTRRAKQHSQTTAPNSRPSTKIDITPNGLDGVL